MSKYSTLYEFGMITSQPVVEMPEVLQTDIILEAIDYSIETRRGLALWDDIIDHCEACGLDNNHVTRGVELLIEKGIITEVDLGKFVQLRSEEKEEE